MFCGCDGGMRVGERNVVSVGYMGCKGVLCLC